MSRFEDLRKNEWYAGWVGDVFTLNHLPGRIFVFGPAKTISGVGHLVQIRSQPIQIPYEEWCSGTDSTFFLPWNTRAIVPRTWVRISEQGFQYSGDLAYVLGAARTTDSTLIAVVPRVGGNLPDKVAGEQKGKEKEKQRKPRVKKLPAALFDEDAMIARFGQEVVNVLPLKNRSDFIKIF